MTEVMGSKAAVAVVRGSAAGVRSQPLASGESAPAPQGSLSGVAAAVEILEAARSTESYLRSASREVSESAAIQGRLDALESVTGRNSLDRAASELADLIRQVEVKLASKSCGSPSNSDREIR